MKKQLALIVVIIAFTYTTGLANNDHGPAHKIKARTGDTIAPGSPEWIQAGSPRNTATGKPVVLIWDDSGHLVPNTPENSEAIRLKIARLEIERESPDRIVLRPVQRKLSVSTSKDTGWDPYKWVMHWTDSVATFYKDPDFLESVEDYYRRPTRLDYYPTIYPIKS